ncbi:MAG TPA: biotin/lipoyl-containing protein [Gemmatimonadales bacterium]|nr:biotin/lipoyl-containing protein [Gemmatimonadales bacterium]
MKYFVSVGGREVEVEVNGDQVIVAGRTLTAQLEHLPGVPLAVVTLDGRPRTLPIERGARGRWVITVDGERHELDVVDERTRHIRSLAGPGAAAALGGLLRAPMPGLVVRVQVEPGQRVAAGAPLVVLEAMKMENQLKAAAPGVVKAVLVSAGEAVEKGKALVELAPEESGAGGST